MIEIKSGNIKPYTEVTVPGSKSYTHRILIAAALSNGECTLTNCLKSEDTLLTQNALKQMGVNFDEDGQLKLVSGVNGKIGPSNEDIYLANSGTSMRLLRTRSRLLRRSQSKLKPTLFKRSMRISSRPFSWVTFSARLPIGAKTCSRALVFS